MKRHLGTLALAALACTLLAELALVALSDTTLERVASAAVACAAASLLTLAALNEAARRHQPRTPSLSFATVNFTRGEDGVLVALADNPTGPQVIEVPPEVEADGPESIIDYVSCRLDV